MEWDNFWSYTLMEIIDKIAVHNNNKVIRRLWKKVIPKENINGTIGVIKKTQKSSESFLVVAGNTAHAD